VDQDNLEIKNNDDDGFKSQIKEDAREQFIKCLKLLCRHFDER
jgi:hypothetical protein